MLWKAFLLTGILLSAQTPGNRDWAVYLGDKATAHYSPLNQVNKSNVARLKPA